MCLIIIPRSYLQKYCLFETFRLKSQSPLKVKIYSVFRVRVSDLIRQFGFGSLQTGFGFFGFGLPSSFGSVVSGSGFGFARTRPVRNTNTHLRTRSLPRCMSVSNLVKISLLLRELWKDRQTDRSIT